MRTPIPQPASLNLFALLSVLLLGACNTTGEKWDWSDVPEPKEPRIDLVQVQHSVAFVYGSAHLAESEMEKLNGFLNRNAVAAGDPVFVIGGEGPDALVERRRQTVAAYLTHLSLQPSAKNDGFGFKSSAEHSVAVVVRRHIVSLPGCPDFTEQPGRTWNNTIARNWGCANATNLGLMVANPGDLERGRPGGPMDGEYAVLAIQRYRAGETKPLIPEDVGKTQSQQKESSGSSGSSSGLGFGGL